MADNLVDISFLRVYRVEVFSYNNATTPLLLKENLDGSNEVTNIQFKTTYSTEGTGSKTQKTILKFYNLSEDEKKALHDSTDQLLNVYAGYYFRFGQTAQEPKKIFSGDIKYVKSARTKGDIVTEVYLEPGSIMKKVGKVSQEFNNRTVGEIARDLANSFINEFRAVAPVAPNSFQVKINIAPEVANSQVLRRVIYEGKSSRAMDKFCRDYNLKWLIFLDTIYIYSKDYVPSPNPVAYLLNPEAVVGELEQVTETSTNKTTKSSDQRNLAFTSYLTPEIIPDTIVIVSDEFNDQGTSYSGKYRVVSVEHILDYRSMSWFTKVEIKQRLEKDSADAN